MKIALLAPIEETVPPIKYGGAELVVANLAKGLVKNGHDVHLFAAGGSQTPAHLEKVLERPGRELSPNPKDGQLREALKYQALGESLSRIRQQKFDVIHNHIGWRMLPFTGTVDAPVVTTLHSPLTIGYAKFIFDAHPNSAYVSISDSQRTPLPGLRYAATVYNGIDVASFTMNNTPGDYVAFLGRMSPDKGPLQAIMAAKAAKTRIVMAAKVDAADTEYFNAEIKPLIDDDQVVFLGEVDHAGKVELLRNAKALMALIQWDEPFGLFMVESLACGTPVIAIPRGSVPELIDNGVTGLFVHTVDEAATAISTITTLDRAACRAAVEQRFSIESMVTGYEAVYRSEIAAFQV